MLLGLYLSLWHQAQALARSRERRAHPGAVSVATMRPELRGLARGLTFDGSALHELVEPAKLVTVKEELVDGTVLRRAASDPLRGGRPTRLRHGLALLLFHRPLTMPPVVEGVIETMVVDTASASTSTWEQTYARNRAAHRQQLWLGELGDGDFERFCSERDIPLVRFDWALLAASAALRGGASPLSSRALDERAGERPPVTWRLVSDEEREAEFKLVYDGLRTMRKLGRSEMPDGLRDAYRLAGLLSRLACPLEAYERAAGPNPYAQNVRQLLNQCEQVTRTAFVGRRWKDAFDDHWGVVMAALRNLVRFAEHADRHPGKDEALAERVIAALDASESVRVLCQTRAEVLATREGLDAYELGAEQGVRVASYADRSLWGPDGPHVTVLAAPPPPWRAALLLSGERGRVEALCYEHEIGRLYAAVRAARADYRGLEHNAGVADRLRLPPSGAPVVEYTPALEELLVQGDGYGTRTAPAPDPELDLTDPGAGASCWEELVGLYGQELPLGSFTEDEPGVDAQQAYAGSARLLRFSDAQPVFFRDDAPVTVYRPHAPEDESPVVSLLPGELTAGMTVVFLPGAERSDLLGTLTDSFHGQLEMERRMFEPLYREALEAAVAKVGMTGLARACGHIPDTVRDWLDGQTWPQKPEKFAVILALADLPHVTRAQASIWRFFERVRGAHRYIGRLLNEAVEDAVHLNGSHEHLDALSRLVGRDLSDIFDQVEAVTVASVGPPQRIPLAATGQFLDPDDPFIRKEGYA